MSQQIAIYTPPDSKPRPRYGRLRSAISKAAAWFGVATIGALAVPAGLLVGIIALIWTGVNAITRWLDQS